MVIAFRTLIPITIPWGGKKSSTIVNGKYIESVDIYRPAIVLVEAHLVASNDNSSNLK